MMAAPFGRQSRQELVELLLGADVDAARRIVEQDDPRPGHQPLADDDLLLVSAGESGHRPIDAVRLDLEELRHLVDGRPFGGPIDDAEAAEPLDRCERQVVAHRHGQHQPFVLAILGDERHSHSVGLCHAGAAHLHRLPADLDRAGSADNGAEERKEQLLLALPIKAAESDDFARTDLEVDSVEPAGPRQVPNFEDRGGVSSLGCARRKDAAVLTSDHQLDDRVVRFRPCGKGFDVAPVAEHRAVVGKLGDLMHAMRNVDDRHPVLSQLLEHGENLLDVGGGQRRGRLVEDQDLGVAGERLGDLDHLAPGQRELASRRVRMDVFGPDAGEERLGDPALLATVDQAEP